MGKKLEQMLAEQPERVIAAATEMASLILAKLDKEKPPEEGGKMDGSDEN
ncbi:MULTISPECIES: hypothetical protein [Gammaproteobacteria]|nr:MULTISPECIES: hypothetical protein [Gammaproteobacteria]EHO4011607.1 hypothetical protein [Escherichia coli]EHX75581.1 hypothetical protein ECDEC14B_4353 [Escherichia coli DEC14B]EHX85222.1 hypothetical protein ECDEC14C_4263 [Escherichia coli DEC14C]EHW85179.1 hypothetical protein ECDEC10E_4676 [Escherichia coli DEC10E]EHX88532.1 hypothetical protein ECDEC14D_4215 [Escherichia coli DEC14D]